ncbi:AlkA N-terminal domain-containing protein [Myxococcus sp. 1LA]
MNGLDPSACYRAMQTRDARFDGRFFTAVRTTRIYCRPICPARTPRFENCTFYPSAAGAQEAGYRPCLRCRPETSPDLAFWRGTSNTVARALALIAEGGLDEDGAGVSELADRLGVGDRQLRRLFQQHLGASPVAVAQTRRVLFARQLLHETTLPMAQVALASGFHSVRRFNDVFRALYGRPPSALRRSRAPVATAAAGVTLFIPYQPPYDWESMLAHLEARALPGLEHVEAGRYRRTVTTPGGQGAVEITRASGRDGLLAKLRLPAVQALPTVVAQVRRVFDVGADMEVIQAHLSRDAVLAPLVAQRPGLRAPGGWDGFELAIRAVLGQQVTLTAARGLGARLVATYGEPVGVESTGDGRLTHTFPRPERLAREDLRSLGMPAARARTLSNLAAAAVADPLLFQPRATMEETVERFKRIPGIGDWTAQYIALRAVREADAFPSADVALLRALSDAQGVRPSPDEALHRSEAWSPWRAYAAQHLWAADAARPAPLLRVPRTPAPRRDDDAPTAAFAHGPRSHSARLDAGRL